MEALLVTLLETSYWRLAIEDYLLDILLKTRDLSIGETVHRCGWCSDAEWFAENSAS